MKIRLISDVHHEFGKLDNVLPKSFDDEKCVLVIAGDFVDAKPANRLLIVPIIEEYCSRFKAVVMIPGNHEYYGGRIDRNKITGDYNKLFGHLKNFHFLVRDSVDIDGFKFVGATLWTDLNNDPFIQSVIAMYLNDFRRITYYHEKTGSFSKFWAQHFVAEHRKDLQFIKTQVEESDLPVIVISHHAPSLLSRDERYANDNLTTYAYHNQLDSFIIDNPQIKMWLHGHIHQESDYLIGDCNVICNPVGYVGEDVMNRPTQTFNVYME